MKLLKEFQKQVSEFKSLKRVWLTSFNINIEFIEKYILPAVLEREVPKTRMDYEALQVELGNSGIDFRVFCDKRFMGLEGNKRTAIPIYGVSPENLGFSRDSIFHAKVIYLEGDQSHSRVIGAGSANLTLDGWARNQEVFHFEKIESTAMQDSVVQFFSSLFVNVDPITKIESLEDLQENSKVRFSHSFQPVPFLEQLSSGVSFKEMSVWSPYFPKDLAAFVEKLKRYLGEPSLKLKIVPDRVDGKYLRTKWTEAIDNQIKRNDIGFFNRPVSMDDRASFCHAKIWKTDAHLALGSWNFTSAGSNIPRDKDSDFRLTSNIEAGFIIEAESSVESILGSSFKAGENAFAKQEELDEAALDIPDVLPFDLIITFNWNDLTYRFDGTWNGGVIQSNAYRLRLPGLEATVPLVWTAENKALEVNPINVTRSEELLAERKYEVLNSEELVGYGLIIEKGLQYRRPQQYTDLRGLLDAVILGADDDSDAPISVQEDESGRLLVNGKPLHDEHPAHIEQSHEESISYFRLFSASYHYAAKLSHLQDMGALEHWVFMRPGCLDELLKKTQDKIGGFRETTVFNWFLAKEVDGLVQLAKSRRDALDKNNAKFPLSRWNALEIAIPKMSKDASAKYRAIIEMEFKRMHEAWGKHE